MWRLPLYCSISVSSLFSSTRPGPSAFRITTSPGLKPASSKAARPIVTWCLLEILARATGGAAAVDVEVVTPLALDLLRAFDAPRPVRLLGVRVAGLDEEKHESPQLALPL